MGSFAWAADARLALVIGNSKYVEFGTLKNPQNDAKGVEKALKEMGYSTRIVLDADESTMRREVKRFAAASQGVDVALVYYAGHGSQVNGENYLLPTDLDIPKVETDIQLSSIKVDDIINSLRSKVKIVLLDACRDNPYLSKNLVKGRGSFRGGLAPINNSLDLGASEGVFIAYATDAGNVASDGGETGNSPFTAALLKNIKEPVSIDDMFSMVTKDVRKATANKQRPYKYASLDSIFCIPKNCKDIANTISSAKKIEGNNNAIESKFKFLAEDKWTVFSEDLDTSFLLDYKSIEINGNKRKVNTLSYRFGPQNDPKNLFKQDTYTKGEVVLDCINNSYYVTQTDIYNNNYEPLHTNFFGDWKLVKISTKIEPETVLDFLKLVVCGTLEIPTMQMGSIMQKFWSSSAEAEVNGLKKMIVSSSFYDKKSIVKKSDFARVYIRVEKSSPVPSLAASNIKYRELTEASNLYKVIYIDRILSFDCTKNIVQSSHSFFYAENLKAPVHIVNNLAEEVIPLGSYDTLKKISCEEIL